MHVASLLPFLLLAAAMGGCLTSPSSPEGAEEWPAAIQLDRECESSYCTFDAQSNTLTVEGAKFTKRVQSGTTSALRVAELDFNLVLRNSVVANASDGLVVEDLACDCSITLENVTLLGDGSGLQTSGLSILYSAKPHQISLNLDGVQIRGYEWGLQGYFIHRFEARGLELECTKSGLLLPDAVRFSASRLHGFGCSESTVATTAVEFELLDSEITGGNRSIEVSAWGGTGRIQNLTVTGAGGNAIVLIGQDDVRVEDSVISAAMANGAGFISCADGVALCASNAQLTIRESCLVGPGVVVLESSGIEMKILDASSNWWNSPSGPFVAPLPPLDPESSGVSKYVHYMPFLDAPPATCQ